jgi:PAS domain S-box-containing protein
MRRTKNQTQKKISPRNKRKLALALEAGHLVPWEINLTTREVTDSAGLRKLFGIDDGQSMQYREDWSSLVLPEDRILIQNAMEEALTGKDYQVQYRIRRPDGEVRWIDSQGRVIKDNNDQSIYLIGVASDITERKRAEAALRASEEKYRNLVETAGEGIVLARPEGPYYYVNQRMADMLGYSIEEILGKSSTDFTFEGWQPQVFQARKELHKGDFIQGEFKFRRKDGSVLWSRYNASPLFNEKGEHIANLALHTDITEHKQAGERIDFERRRLKAVLETIPVAVVIVEARDSHFSYINRRAKELYGYDSSGLTLKENVAAVKPKRLDGSPYPINELPVYLALQGQTVSNKELILERPDGTTYPIYGSAAPILDAQGKVMAAVVIFEDITERKRWEESQARAKDELELKVEERTRELARANNQLKQYANRITDVQEAERKRIAYELHDDTAQYLSIVKMQINGLLHSEKVRDPQILKKLEYLERDADRAFHDVKRYSHELRPVVLENLGLTAALEQIADDYNVLKQLHVEVNVEGSEPELSEEVKLGFFRIAQEALNNARKHAKASEAIINLSFQGNHIETSVKDNGAGFDVKESTERAGGKGSLGLLSMQERAQLIGAELNIESEPEKGTTVTAKLKL